METIDIINYLDIFKRFGKDELKNFKSDYESCIFFAVANSLDKENAENDDLSKFLEKWSYNFGQRKFLLKRIFCFPPRKVYALLELCS